MDSRRILLADDHAIVRAGIRNALTNLPNIEIVGEAGNGKELAEALAALRPDLLVLDVHMPEFDPLPAIRRIKTEYPGLKILVVSAYNDEAYVVGTLSAGVDGYHIKDQPLSDLQLAVRRVLSGERWISSSLIGRLVDHRKTARAGAVQRLTSRQRELLRMLAQGCDNRKIAQAMEISVKTVENHLTALYRALKVESRLEALNYAIRHPEILGAVAGEVAVENRPPQASLAVLLVDDNPRYRKQLGRIIGKERPAAVLYEAEDAYEALNLAQKVHPHLALVDVLLKDENGIQCARRLKQTSPSTRIVLISAYPDREFRRVWSESGAVAFLDKKDLDSAAVKQVLEDVLGLQ
ncbi:MAG: response regulator [Anaerolineales bacterium]|nr:response regulator [Anaerolineales bacterium]